MTVRTVRVGEFRVSDWTECVRCGEVYLKNVSISECPYYLCLRDEDESIHDRYVAIAKKRFPDYLKEKRYTYGSLMRLAFRIAKNGWQGMGQGNEAIRIYKDSTLLHDGHHRAAVLYAIHGGEFTIEVEEREDREKPSAHQCPLER